jgi:hypothetical protein
MGCHISCAVWLPKMLCLFVWLKPLDGIGGGGG